MMIPRIFFLANSPDFHKSVLKQNLGKNVRELPNFGSYFLRISQPFNIVELVSGFKKKVLLANIKQELYVGQSWGLETKRLTLGPRVMTPELQDKNLFVCIISRFWVILFIEIQPFVVKGIEIGDDKQTDRQKDKQTEK